MKKIFLFFITIVCCQQLTLAQDSLHYYIEGLIKADSLRSATVLQHIDSLQKVNSASNTTMIASKDSTDSKLCNCKPHIPEKLCCIEWLLVFSPLLIFIIILFGVVSISKDFSFKDALSENEQIKKTIINPEYSAAKLLSLQAVLNLSVLIPPTIEVTDLPEKEITNPQEKLLSSPPEMEITDDSALLKQTIKSTEIYRPSISRYIAFITSMLTLVIALAMSCFFIYRYISVGCPPDFSALSTILIALGFGIAPYAFNKVSTAIKGKDN